MVPPIHMITFGNITAINSHHESNILNASFTYDELYRLTSANYSTGRRTNYVYEYDDFATCEGFLRMG